MSEDHNTCSTCMFFDPKHSHCDKHNDGTHEDFECNDWKERVK